jgi:hypothetical protein
MAALNPMTIALLAEGVKFGTGAFQNFRAEKIARNNVRPMANISEEARRALAIAENLASTSTIPAQGLYENRIDKNFYASLGAARDGAENPAQLLESVIALSDNAALMEENLNIRGIERSDRMMQQLQGALGTMDRLKMENFELNKLAPYLETAGRASALKGAGLQNMMGAFDSVAASMIAQGQNNEFAEILKQLQQGTGEEETMLESVENGTGPEVDIPDNGLDNPIFKALVEQALKDIGSMNLFDKERTLDNTSIHQ